MMKTAHSLFSTKTFQASTATLISGLLVIVVNCTYDNHKPTKADALTAVSLVSAYVWALIGRASNEPVYTPNGLPGANKSDFKNSISDSNNTVNDSSSN